jgi:hypothetical protein
MHVRAAVAVAGGVKDKADGAQTKPGMERPAGEARGSAAYLARARKIILSWCGAQALMWTAVCLPRGSPGHKMQSMAIHEERGS